MVAQCGLADRSVRSKPWSVASKRWGEALSINAKSTNETLIVKLFHEEGLFGKADFLGQAVVPLADLPEDGEPMGFDLTLEAVGKREDQRAPSIGLELTYNRLTTGGGGAKKAQEMNAVV